MELACPGCGRVNDQATSHEDIQPSEGDVSICWKCHTIAIFHEVGGVMYTRLPNREEAAELAADPEIKRYVHAMTEAYTPLQSIEMLK